MTTAVIADRLVSLCKEGKFIQAQQELYDAEIISIDPDGSRTIGVTNMHLKEQRFLDSLDKIHSISFSNPLIAGSYFTVKLRMEIAIKKIGYKEFEEICVYETKDGKIIFEQFFRNTPKIA